MPRAAKVLPRPRGPYSRVRLLRDRIGSRIAARGGRSAASSSGAERTRGIGGGAWGSGGMGVTLAGECAIKKKNLRIKEAGNAMSGDRAVRSLVTPTQVLEPHDSHEIHEDCRLCLAPLAYRRFLMRNLFYPAPGVCCEMQEGGRAMPTPSASAASHANGKAGATGGSSRARRNAA